jgi:glyoxylase I family protein
MRINGIHHVAIICSNYEDSKRFYTEVLGFTVIQETHRESRQSHKLDLKIAEKYQIELFSFPNPPQRMNYPEACGLRHLAFEVDDIDSAYNYLTSRGVEVEDIVMDPITGKRFMFFCDPDNLPLEIYEK